MDRETFVSHLLLMGFIPLGFTPQILFLPSNKTSNRWRAAVHVVIREDNEIIITLRGHEIHAWDKNKFLDGFPQALDYLKGGAC